METKKLLRVLNGTIEKTPPRWFMRQAGRYLPEYKQTRSRYKTFKEFLFATPDITEVTLQPLRRFNLDAAIIFSDILVVPMLMGMEVDVIDQVGPKLDAYVDSKAVSAQEIPSTYAKCDPIYEAISNVKAQLDPTKALIGFAGAPWTVASYMLEGKTSKTFGITRTFAYKHPSEFYHLLNIISDVTAQHLINQIKAGADVIKLFDSWAGAVPHDKLEDWVVKPQKRIVEQVRAVYPEIPIITFLKGQESSYETYTSMIPVNGVALGTTADIVAVKNTLSPRLAVQGALDPFLLVAGGEEMVKTISHQVKLFQDRPYIFNLGHGIVPETPIEHVQLALDTLDRLGE